VEFRIDQATGFLGSLKRVVKGYRNLAPQKHGFNVRMGDEVT